MTNGKIIFYEEIFIYSFIFFTIEGHQTPLGNPSKVNNLNQLSGNSPSPPPSPTPSCLFVLPNTHTHISTMPLLATLSLLSSIYLYFSHSFSSYLVFSRSLSFSFSLSFVPPFFHNSFCLTFYPCLTPPGPSPWRLPLCCPPVLSLGPLRADRSVLSVLGHCAPRDNKLQSTPL